MKTLLLALLFAAAPSVRAAPTNVVMIISDDHAWTDYGFMGHAGIKTPHLDRLAGQSLAFRHGYVPSSLCCPSLATIVTGLYPHQHRITSNDPPKPEGMKPAEFQKSAAFLAGRETMNRFMEEVPTLPRLLRDQGYLCLQTGKWWQGDFKRGGFTHGMTRGGRHGDDGLKIGRESMDPIPSFIAEAKAAGKPFLVWYAPMMPHDPHTPPERFLARHRDTAPSLHVARYRAMVEWFDETCGDLLKIVDDAGVAENTIVVYVTDNGWIQSPDTPRYAPKSKQSPYDGGLRTPILLRWPGRIAPRQDDTPVMSIDLMPTLLRLLGQTPPPGLPGLDLTDPAAVRARPALMGECFLHNAVDLNAPGKSLTFRWTRSGSEKLIVPADPATPPELYDLAADPHEEKNLAPDRPDRVRSLREGLDAWWKP